MKKEKFQLREKSKEVRESVGYDKIIVDKAQSTIRKQHPALYLDLSAIAKGWAVDKVGELLESLELANYMVEIGGEVKTKGSKAGEAPWEIGIVGPHEGGLFPKKVISLKDASMATSGDYLNYFTHGGKKYSHIIDRKTGRPVDAPFIGVTVIDRSGSCMRADALSTALMAMGRDAALAFAKKHKIEAFFLYKEKDALVLKSSMEGRGKQ